MITAIALILFFVAACADDFPTPPAETIADQQLAELAGDHQVEPAREMNDVEAAVYDEAALCAEVDYPTRPTIEYCTCAPSPCSPCVEVEKVAAEYRADLDRISIDPKWRGDAALLRHEAIHALLARRDGDLDSCHLSPFFTECSDVAGERC